MFPVSRTTNCGLATIALAMGAEPSDGHDLGLVLEALVLLSLELLLDAHAVVVGHLVHADGPFGPPRQELADDAVVGGAHLVPGAEHLETGAEEDAHVLGRAHHRRDVVGDD